jgi:hypothetical protein
MRNIRLGRMCPKEINALAYYTEALITAVKSFKLNHQKEWDILDKGECVEQNRSTH